MAKKKELPIPSSAAEYLTYIASTGNSPESFEMRYEDENIWLTQKMMASLYEVDVRTINDHIQKIYDDGELTKDATIRKFRIVQTEGSRQVKRNVMHYNLQLIISVGFKVNNDRAVRFRKWAGQIVKDYTIQGWVMDPERLKKGHKFTEDFFERQLQQIREIRLSERRFYQKVTDIYATAFDYDKDAKTTQEFFKTVQNKMHYAVHRHTAAELIVERADANKDHMGLTTWENAPDGKRVESYISFENVKDLKAGIEERKKLEKELKELKRLIPKDESPAIRKQSFKTKVRTGKELEAQIAPTRRYKKRECISTLRDYVFGPVQDKVLIIYGLRRTGKTTMIRQVLTELPQAEFGKAAFIQVTSSDTLADVDSDLRKLEKSGYRYFFIDEVTLMEDFVEGAALFSDIYASSGMKIILSGTDSLGFAFTRKEQLYDRCILLHTTFIPYREFERVLGVCGIDEYIRYGGTMSLGGINYNDDTPFSDPKHTEEYIFAAIARNIQHSLKTYQYGGHFRLLLDLYERGELTNVINRVVENINHSFTKEVIERTFKSHDIAVTAANLLRDRETPVNIKEHMDLDSVTSGIMKMLDILNKEDQSIDVDADHMTQIREYLTMLDLIMEIDLESLPEVNRKGKVTVITQPGMRYAQAEAITTNMLLDSEFQELPIKERQRILDRLLSEIRGRMMEDIVLLETKLANPKKKVFKLQFAIGEFDMVVFDPKEPGCEIYEVKYSKEVVEEQYRHLDDEVKCAMTTHRYGNIKSKYVIYRGANISCGDIHYLNVEEYLKSLSQVGGVKRALWDCFHPNYTLKCELDVE